MNNAISCNNITGLREGFHDKYNLPIVFQKSVKGTKFSGQRTAVHTLPIGSVGSLDFYAQLGRNDELIVGFHGATPKARNVYPRFERVRSFRNLTNSFMNFADPTLQLDPKSEMRLSWYLGGPGWDPIYDIAKIVRKVKGKTGAKHFAFVGGSGGGHAALRISALFPGSLAFVQEPQTNVAKYWESVVRKYFATAWPGWKYQDLLEAFPARFDMNYLYANQVPNNTVYYTQSRADSSHLDDHCRPFMKSVGLPEGQLRSTDGMRNFMIYDGEVEGHGRISATEFNRFYNEAVAIWRDVR